MSRYRRPLLILAFGLLALSVSACSSGRAGANSDVDLKVVATHTAGGSGQSSRPPVISATAGTGQPVAHSQGQTAATIGNTNTARTAAGIHLPPAAAVDKKNVVVVDGTGGAGAWMRTAPAGDPMRTWPDGAPMLVIGDDQDAAGRTWRNVWTADGAAGWVASDYLSPADPDQLQAALSAAGMQGPGAAPATRAAATPASIIQPAATPAAVTAPTGVSSQTARLQASAPVAAAAPTQTPQSTAAPAATPTAAASGPATPTAFPAPNGSHTAADGDLTMTVQSVVRNMPIQIGNRPRAGMELVGVEVDVANTGKSSAAVYRSGFRLVLADKTRVEPLAGQEPALGYSVDLPAGNELDGWLTFEVPTGAKIDSVVWSPDRSTSYAVSI